MVRVNLNGPARSAIRRATHSSRGDMSCRSKKETKFHSLILLKQARAWIDLRAGPSASELLGTSTGTEARRVLWEPLPPPLPPLERVFEDLGGMLIERA